MRDILETMIKYSDDKHGQSEALIEFLYALAFGKLTMKKQHIKEIIVWLNNLDYDIVKLFKNYIQDITLEEVYFEKRES